MRVISTKSCLHLSTVSVSRGAMLIALAAGATPAFAQTSPTPAAQPDPAAAAAPAQAPVGLQDIVVTARRTAERLQDVPLSAIAIGGQAARDAHIASVQDMKGTIPNVNVQKTSVPGSGNIQIRGIELGAIPFTGADTRVGIYIDGVYLGRTTGNSSPLADIERIEVLKGPQGTLFGKNETGGAVNFITKNPKGEFGGTAEIGTGNDGRQHYRISVDTPTFGNFSARATYTRDVDTGDVRNLAGGTQYGPYVNNAIGFNDIPTKTVDRFNASKTDSVFFALRYDGGPLTVDYKFDYTKLKDSGGAFQPLGFPGNFLGCIGAALRFGTAINCGIPQLNTPFPVTSAAANAINPPTSFTRQSALALDQWGYSKVTHWGQSLTIQYVANDKLTLKSITGYRHLTAHQQADTDGFALFAINDIFNLVGANPPLPAGGTNSYCGGCSDGGSNQHEFSEEFQVIGKPAQWLEYIVGAYYFYEHPAQTYFFETNVVPLGTPSGIGVPPLVTNGVNTLGRDTFNNGDNSVVHSRSRAIYAHVTGHVGNFDIAVGGRYTQDRKRSFYGDIDPITGLEVPIIGKVGFNKFTYDASVTYKFTPDINAYVRYATAYLAGGIISGVAFKPETTKAVEGGVKSELFDRRLRLNVAGFYQESKDAQNYLNLPSGQLALENVPGTLKTSGFEVEAALAVARGLTVSANGGYTHQVFPLDPVTKLRERSDVPKWSAQFAVQYDTPPVWDDAHLQIKVDANYRSRYHNIRFPLTSLSSGLADGTQLPANVIAGYPDTASYLAALDKAATSGGYWLANARLSLVDIALGGTKGRVSGFVQNMFNSKGVLQGEDNGTGVGATFETARRYGIDFTLDF